MDIELNENWRHFDEGKSIGQEGSEEGIIILDIEHIEGARVTLEKETHVSPFATTLGVYGLMFHTRRDGNETEAKEFIQLTIQKIDSLFKMCDIPEDQQDDVWKEKFNTLTRSLAEQ